MLIPPTLRAGAALCAISLLTSCSDEEPLGSQSLPDAASDGAQEGSSASDVEAEKAPADGSVGDGSVDVDAAIDGDAASDGADALDQAVDNDTDVTPDAACTGVAATRAVAPSADFPFSLAVDAG